MIRRVFKTIFILSLCFGITIPSNAAVSVSDGSAFVSKAELSADLNNLSNRMAQLENSLDAKIDSLVSSYLARNGIWNGANQELKVGGYIQKANNKFELNNPPISFTTKPEAKYVDNIYGNSEFFTANKSGLLCISVGTYGDYNSTTGKYYTDNRRFFCYVLSNNPDIANYGGAVVDQSRARSATIDWSPGAYLGWEIMDGSDIKVACNIIETRPLSRIIRYESDTSYYTTGYMVMYTNFYTIIQCFVEKDKTYYQRLRFKYNQGGCATSSFSFTAADTWGGTWKMIIDYAAVY